MIVFMPYPNTYAYNPMRLNIGSIARWQGPQPVLVSPDYVVFQTNEDQLSPDYLDHLRSSLSWAQFVSTAGSGSVRTRIYYSQLATMKILLPPLPEQKKIAGFLNLLDREINILERLASAIQRQKEALMQQLLTGKIRVKV